MEKLLLILDIDETLIHARTEELCGLKYDFKVFNFYVYKRPYLDHFLSFVFENYHVAFWSSASDDYVEEIIQKLLNDNQKPKFIWGNKRCTPMSVDLLNEFGYYNHTSNHYVYTKCLKKVKKYGYRLERTLIVDDTPAKVVKNYGNAIYIDEFTGSTTDNMLNYLKDYLKELEVIQNVREIEKRWWKHKFLLT